jgi:hypothetical protein
MPPLDGRDDDLTLARLDVLGDSDGLRAQAEQLMRTAGGETRAPDHHEGADESDSIWVAVDARGRVESVDISRRWREQLGVGRFADGLFEAYTAAVGKSLTAAASAALSDEQEPQAPAWPDASIPGPDRAQPEPLEDDRAWLATTWNALDGIDAELKRLTRMEADGVGAADHDTALSSPGGYLTVRLRGRTLVGISGNVTRIATADAQQLRLDALAALRAAQRPADGDPAS